jgi:hypothetical protein
MATMNVAASRKSTPRVWLIRQTRVTRGRTHFGARDEPGRLFLAATVRGRGGCTHFARPQCPRRSLGGRQTFPAL